jgi:transposase
MRFNQFDELAHGHLGQLQVAPNRAKDRHRDGAASEAYGLSEHFASSSSFVGSAAPLSPGRLERHGFEYRRNGTLSLYAALDVKTGKVQGKTAERHTSAEFVGFLEQIISGCKPNQEIHIILDNLSAHKTNQVEQFLKRNANVNLHFTPTYSSWLNQVEIWFARLEREVIARGIFTSVQDLSRKLMRYIRAYSKTARPFKWKYSDVRRRILPC